VYVAGEVRDPARSLPRALVGATLLVTALYVALNAVFLYAAPASALADRAEVGAVAAEALGGAPMRRALSALVALGLLTSVSAMVMAGPRVYQRMAADGLLPAVLGRAGDVPRAAIALQTALALVAFHVGSLAELLSYAGFLLGVSAAATVGGLVRLRAREGPARLPVPGYPWLPLLFVATTLGSAAFLVAREPAQAGAGLATVALGLPLYAWARRR
jgi:APA family basic amino acid/polyamine antiporter